MYEILDKYNNCVETFCSFDEAVDFVDNMKYNLGELFAVYEDGRYVYGY